MRKISKVSALLLAVVLFVGLSVPAMAAVEGSRNPNASPLIASVTYDGTDIVVTFTEPMNTGTIMLGMDFVQAWTVAWAADDTVLTINGAFDITAENYTLMIPVMQTKAEKKDIVEMNIFEFLLDDYLADAIALCEAKNGHTFNGAWGDWEPTSWEACTNAYNAAVLVRDNAGATGKQKAEAAIALVDAVNALWVDKGNLNMYVEAYERMEPDQNKYTAASWAAFKEKYDIGKPINDDPGAKQKDVYEAFNALYNAYIGLSEITVGLGGTQLSAVSLKKGQMSAIALDTNGLDLVYKSSNTAAVTVSQKAVLTGVKAGTSIITVTDTRSEEFITFVAICTG